ncbi:cytochrome c oxidase subunit 4 isoform 1, mitochondrial [Drosophila rhopaloa]|uniref:Cytochrome c oxidase subunit 4 n=1 Tax=Drosophila rhopaloa TaxID=1041015 RepID=A0A6P4EP15_DRORH|nr:cytochrome c oxidase subunit 4 isoform 1, mitochondrial [Drosophila rhopaloa]XP_016979911.1 cytochrome c oxidase subunit 4 isoform 1, mitochondrial [Drosophila rhopaloa]
MSALRLIPRGNARNLSQMLMMGRRFASGGDGIRLMIGDREVVGYGINGRPVYLDSTDCPFPAIRYREVTPELCAIREKELGDWKKLSLDDKKMLYRHSFCQTFVEFKYFTPEWKICLGVALWLVAIALGLTMLLKTKMYGEMPETFEEERRSAQLRRMIQLQINPITGISSKWCYGENKWKSQVD